MKMAQLVLCGVLLLSALVIIAIAWSALSTALAPVVAALAGL